MPTISVLLPVYEPKPEWLEAAIQSILNQSYNDYELVIVDDHSSSRVEDILESRNIQDDKIRLFRNESNQGFTKATNTAIKKSKGTYIAPIGDDDLWEKKKLEKQAKFLEKGYDLVFSKANIIDKNKTKIGHKGSFPQDKHFTGLFFQSYPCYETSIIRRSILDKKGLLDESLSIASDWDLWLSLWPKSDVKYIDEFLATKRRHEEKITVENYNKLVEEGEKVLKKHLDKYEKIQSFRKEVLCSFYRKKGRRYFERGEKDNARELWKKALSTHPADYKAWMLYLSSVTNTSYNAVNDAYSIIKGKERSEIAKN